MVRKTSGFLGNSSGVRAAWGLGLVAACLLGSGCTTGRTGVNHAMAWGPASQARHAQGHDGVVVGVKPQATGDGSYAGGWSGGDEGVPVTLASRRDQALGLRAAGTLFEAESWSPAPMPSLDRKRSIYVSPNPSTHTYFRHGDGTLTPRYEGGPGNSVR